MKSILLIGVTVIIVALLLITRPNSKAALQSLPLSRVLTSEVLQRDIQPVTQIKGQLEPSRKISLNMEASGKVIARQVEPGQQVNTGQLILAVEDNDFLDAVTRARALLEQEENAVERDSELLALLGEQMTIQRREVDRLEKLDRESLTSKSNYDAALRALLQLQEQQTRLQYSVNSSRSRLASLQSDLNLAKRNLARSQLVAPFSATVNAVFSDIGDYINAGEVAAELVQADTLDLYLEIPGEIARELTLGQEIQINAGNLKISGTIFSLSLDPSALTHTHALKIRVPGEGLLPGQLATASLPGDVFPNALVVPVSSVLREEGNAYLFTVENNRLSRKKIDLLARQGDWFVINGITAGKKIVIKDVGVLADGQEVLIQ